MCIDNIYSWYGCNDFYKKEKEIICNLIENYNFSIYLGYWDEFFRDFSFDELLKLSEEGYHFIKDVIVTQSLFWDKYDFSERTLRYGIRRQYNKDRRKNLVKKLVKNN